MLRALKKLSESEQNFSDKEINLLARYGAGIAKYANARTFERVWEKVSSAIEVKANIINELEWAFGIAAESGQNETLKAVFSKFNKPDRSHLRETLDGMAHEVVPSVAGSGSLETFQSLLSIAQNLGGRKLVASLAATAYYDPIPVTSIDAIYDLVKPYGKKALKDLAGSAGLGFGRALEENKGEIACRLLEKAYLGGGEETLYEVFTAEWSEYIFYAFQKRHEKAITDAFIKAQELGGPSVARKIIEDKDFYFYRTASRYGFLDLLDDMDAVGKDLNDPEFIKRLDDIISETYGLDQDFIDHIDFKLSWIKEGNSDPDYDTPDQVIRRALFVWMRNKHDSDDISMELPPSDSHTAILMTYVVDQMVLLGEWKGLEKMSELLQAVGEPELDVNYSLSFQDVLLHASPAVTEDFLSHVCKAKGNRHVQSILCRPIAIPGHESSGRIYPLHYNAHKGNSEKTIIIANWLEKCGGTELLTNMVGFKDFSLIKVIEKKHPELIHFFIGRLEGAYKDMALDAIDPKWRLFENDEIRKTIFWQEIGKANERWIGMTGSNAPEESLASLSPYKFKPKLYDEILPYIKMASDLEKNREASVFAYKLAVLFSNSVEVDRYLTAYATQWGKESKNVVHDACLLNFPNNGIWSPEKWKSLILKFGPEASKFLPRAVEIEKLIGDKPFPTTVKDLHALARLMHYKRAAENPDFAALASSHGLSQKGFNRGLDILAQSGKTTDLMPDIMIDGEKLGHPDYYMQRLAPNDPTGFVLGIITKCCQHLDDQGADCSIYGMTSPYSGFYVWKKKTQGAITDKDAIVAQSWAWIGSDNAIVFDSFERTKSIHAGLALPFLQQYAHEVVGKHTLGNENETVIAVNLGAAGNTPRLHIKKADTPSFPIDYNGFYHAGAVARDSETQYCIDPKDHYPSNDLSFVSAADLVKAREIAAQYIQVTLDKFHNLYGITVKSGIELEFYALGKDGAPSSNLLKVAAVANDLKASGLSVRFDDENTIDYRGQYEIATDVLSPLEAVRIIEEAKAHIDKNANEYGVDRFDFSPLPFRDEEPSSAHISISLWDKEGEPLFLDTDGPLLNHVIHGLLEIQRSTVLLHAPTPDAYKRYGHSDWSPNAICFGASGGTGISLRVANENNCHALNGYSEASKIRIENRLAASDADPIVAMAANIAGIDLALERYMSIENEIVNEYPVHALPSDMVSAVSLLRAACNDTGYNDDIKTFLGGVLKGYEMTLPQVSCVAEQTFQCDIR